MQYLSAIAEKYQPAVVVVEEPFYAQSLLRSNLCKLTEAIKTWAQWKKLRVYRYYPPGVKAFFCRDRENKESLAEAMIERYPFLRRDTSPSSRGAGGTGSTCSMPLASGSYASRNFVPDPSPKKADPRARKETRYHRSFLGTHKEARWRVRGEIWPR